MASSDRSNVVLTGFMGTGKSTVGRLVAELLGFEFIDTDRVIEERHGPIPVIFQEQGEAAFRDLERQLACELAGSDRLVISTGGRLMLDPLNAAELGRTARVFCLVASPATILQRVFGDAAAVERPLLSGPDPRRRVLELLAERDSGYRRFEQIDTDGISPEQVAARIVSLMRPGEPDDAGPR